MVAMVVLGWGVVLAVGATALVAVATGLLQWSRPASPARRHARALAGLVACLSSSALGVAALAGLEGTSPAAGAGPGFSAPPEVTFATPLEESGERDAHEAVAPSRPVAGEESMSLPLEVALLGGAGGWALGAVLLMVRLAGGLLGARGFARRAVPTPHAWLQAEADRLASRLRLRREVPVLESDDVTSPAALGCRAPVVLVPPGFAERLDRGAVVSLLAHELGHVARNDYAAGLGQRVVGAVLWHCPGARWLCGQASQAREEACDDIAVDLGGGSRAHAGALVAIAGWTHAAWAPGLSAAAAPDLRARIRRLLPGAPPQRGSAWRAAGLALVGAGILPLVFSGTGLAHEHVRRLAAAASAAEAPIPRAFGFEQPGAPLRVIAAPVSARWAFDEVELRNVSEASVTSVTFGVWVDNPERGHLQVFDAAPVRVDLAPGAAARVPVRLVSASQARKLEASFGGFAQAQLVLLAAELDWDGDGRADYPHWRVRPRRGARSVDEAFHIARSGITRATLLRSAEDEGAASAAKRNLCLDDVGRPVSHGGLVPVADGEEGELARCRFGRWVNETGPDPVHETGSNAEYLVRRRGHDTSGMDEQAVAALFQAAAIVSGERGYRVDWSAAGGLRRTFSADPWIGSDADADDWVPDVELVARTGPWFALFKAAADADGSGSITEAEAVFFRFSVELGLVIDALPELGSLQALDRKLMPIDVAPSFRERIAPLSLYIDLTDRARAAGLEGLPPLPASLRREVERRRTGG